MYQLRVIFLQTYYFLGNQKVSLAETDPVSEAPSQWQVLYPKSGVGDTLMQILSGGGGLMGGRLAQSYQNH